MSEAITVLVGFFILMAIGAGLGIALAEERLTRRSRQLDHQAAKLAAAWAAMQKAQRLNQAFWQARLAMRTEALRHLRRPPDPPA
jgi:hypothetical protein